MITPSNTPRTDACDQTTTKDAVRLSEELERELAATKLELENARAMVKKFEPYYLDYISSVSAAGLPADGPCLACNGFGGHEEGCHGTTGLMTMAYELETLRARVRELEKWKLAAKALWRAVMAEDADGQIEDALHGINELLEAERKTLDEAMPRKEGV